jgi:hypothetical protein
MLLIRSTADSIPRNKKKWSERERERETKASRRRKNTSAPLLTNRLTSDRNSRFFIPVMKQSLRRTPRKQQQHIQSCRRPHEILFFQKLAGRKVDDFRGTRNDNTRQEMSGVRNEESVSNGGGKF